jgi:hypothetical protein
MSALGWDALPEDKEMSSPAARGGIRARSAQFCVLMSLKRQIPAAHENIVRQKPTINYLPQKI